MKQIVLIIIISLFSTAIFSQIVDEEEKSEEIKKQEKLEMREQKKKDRIDKKEERKDRPKEMITLMGKADSHGGYAGLGINYTEINDVGALIFGARGSWVIGHSFAFGLGGSGFVSDYKFNSTIGENTNYQGGYGGIYFEPIILPRFPVHISLPIFLGAGGIAEMRDYISQGDDFETSLYDASSFLLIEPGAELEINFFKHFRIAFGAYYRYPATINFSNATLQAENILEGLSMGVTFKLGKF